MLNCRLFLSSNDFPSHVFRGSGPEGPSGVEGMDESVLMDEVLAANPEELVGILDGMSLGQLSNLNESLNEMEKEQNARVIQMNMELNNALQVAYFSKLAESGASFADYADEISNLEPALYQDLFYSISPMFGSRDLSNGNALWMLDQTIDSSSELKDWALSQKYQHVVRLTYDEEARINLLNGPAENITAILNLLRPSGELQETNIWELRRILDAQKSPVMSGIYNLDYDAVFSDVDSMNAHMDSVQYSDEEMQFFKLMASRRVKAGTDSNAHAAYQAFIEREGPY